MLVPSANHSNGRTTLLDALTRAEGLGADAGHEILVTRPANGGVPPFTQRIAVRDLIEKADPAANLPLEGGEEVRVPEVGRVFVVGNVLKPGAFPLNDSRGMSILKALAVAEGLARFATKCYRAMTRQRAHKAQQTSGKPVEEDAGMKATQCLAKDHPAKLPFQDSANGEDDQTMRACAKGGFSFGREPADADAVEFVAHLSRP